MSVKTWLHSAKAHGLTLHDPLMGAVKARHDEVLQRQLLAFGTGVRHQFVVSCCAIGVMAFVFPSSYGLGIKTLWLVLTWLSLGLRLWFGLHYTQVPPSLPEVYRIERLALVVMALNVGLYGLGIWVLYSDDTRLMNLLVVFSFGMLAGGAISLMALPRVMWLYTIGLTGSVVSCLLAHMSSYTGSPGSVGVLLLGGLTSVIFHRSAKLHIITQGLMLEKETLVAQLHHQLSRAEQAHAEKTRFLTAVSHDVRQPAHALMLLSDTASQQMAADPHHPVWPTLQHLHAAAQELHTMLDGLADVSKLQSTPLSAHCQVVELDAVLQRVHALFSSVADHRQQVLRVRLNGAVVWADPHLLFRMVSNLVDNALKFAPEERGCVWVGARRRKGDWHLEVRDNGPGIPPDAHQRIFSAFVQLAPPEGRRASGIGYGLTVVQQFAKAQNNRLGLRSCVGHGSCFSIELPSAAPCIDLAQSAKTRSS